jgi:aspartyl-tRNA(Asn)/glutamyl-tRNA(Gln) amidotransferase subunit A
MSSLTVKQISQGLKNGSFSSVELTKDYLETANKNKDLNSYITLLDRLALEQAQKSDSRRKAGKTLSELDGVPLAIKDNIMISGYRTTAGSKILEDFTTPYDASVIERLKDAGVIFLGKTNMDEFAMGSSTETSYFGPTKNPHDPTRVPGGSSGGSAAAVAAHLAPAALGSDTGGSIRQPASLCGVVGLKPTYGRVSRYGLIAMASSLDQIGPFGQTVEDTAILLNHIVGQDKMDSTSLPKTAEDFTDFLDKGVKGLKIAYLKTKPEKDDGTFKIFHETAEKLKKQGAEVQEVDLDKLLDLALACYYIIVPAEVSSNMARYDGIKYGYSVIHDSKFKIHSLLEVYLKSRAEGLGAEVKRRIILGTYVLSSGYYDAYYKSAQKARDWIKGEFAKIFEKYDVILTPTSPTVAFKLKEKLADPLTMYLSDIFTVPINIASLPAVSVPGGKVGPPGGPPWLGETGEAGNLPVGIQVIGRELDEGKILQVGAEIERIK